MSLRVLSGDPERTLSAYVGFSLPLLRGCGVWPWCGGGRGWRRYLLFSYTAIVAASLPYIFCGIAAFLATKITDLNFLLHESWPLIAALGATTRIMIFLMKLNQLNTLVMKTPFTLTKSVETHLNINKKKARNLAVFTILLILLVNAITYVTNKTIQTQQEGDNPEVNRILNFLPSLFSNQYVKMIFIIFNSCLFGLITVFSEGFSTLFIYLIFCTQAFLDDLTAMVGQVRSRSLGSQHRGRWPSTGNPRVSDVRCCVRQHRFVIKLIDQLNEVFSLQMMFITAFSLLKLCFSAKNYSNDNEELSLRVLVIQVVSLSTHMWKILIFSWLADVIRDKGLRLQSVCLGQVWRSKHGVAGDWKSLEVMAARCEHPLQLRAGPFNRLSISTFTNILALSFSYYIVLRNVKLN